MKGSNLYILGFIYFIPNTELLLLNFSKNWSSRYRTQTKSGQENTLDWFLGEKQIQLSTSNGVWSVFHFFWGPHHKWLNPVLFGVFSIEHHRANRWELINALKPLACALKQSLFVLGGPAANSGSSWDMMHGKKENMTHCLAPVILRAKEKCQSLIWGYEGFPGETNDWIFKVVARPSNRNLARAKF